MAFKPACQFCVESHNAIECQCEPSDRRARIRKEREERAHQERMRRLHEDMAKLRAAEAAKPKFRLGYDYQCDCGGLFGCEYWCVSQQ